MFYNFVGEVEVFFHHSGKPLTVAYRWDDNTFVNRLLKCSLEDL